jgi:hypothetical protein
MQLIDKMLQMLFLGQIRSFFGARKIDQAIALSAKAWGTTGVSSPS